MSPYTFFPHSDAASAVASVRLPIGQSSVASKTYSSPMNPFVIDASFVDECFCDKSMVQNAGWQSSRHSARLPRREVCRKIGAWHETLVEQHASSLLDHSLEAQTDAIMLARRNEEDRSIYPASQIQGSCRREVSVHPQAQLARRNGAGAAGRALRRHCERLPATTAYGGPAPSPSPRSRKFRLDKVSKFDNCIEDQENDPAQALKNDQKSSKNEIVEKTVRGAAYTKAPARTVGVLRKLLQPHTLFGRQGIAKGLKKSENHSRSKKAVTFSSW